MKDSKLYRVIIGSSDKEGDTAAADNRDVIAASVEEAIKKVKKEYGLEKGDYISEVKLLHDSIDIL
jgi:hypothetical protein